MTRKKRSSRKKSKRKPIKRKPKSILDVEITPEEFYRHQPLMSDENLPTSLPLGTGGKKDFFGKIGPICNQVEKTIEEAWNSIVKTLNDPKGIDMHGRFSSEVSADAISRAEVIAYIYDFKALKMYCDLKKQKAVSIGGRSRTENVRMACSIANTQSEMQKSGLINQLKAKELI